jgi:hypothetical protein
MQYQKFIREENFMEHRIEKRKPVRFSFQYNIGEDTSESSHREGTVVDYSDRGIRFESEERLPIGTKLKLDIDPHNPSAKDYLISPEGIVVWSIQPDPEESLYWVGLKYL